MSEVLLDHTDVLRSSRFVASVSYSGDGYHGWQRLKAGLPTVQSVVESAIEKVANHSIETACAGRTDAGVHACHQVIHFESNALRTAHNWVFGINRYLPSNIVVNWVKPINDRFHARFSALSRRYMYIIYNHIIRPIHLTKEVTWYHKELTLSLMEEGAQYLIGEHDFNAYRTVHCQAQHSVRCVKHLTIEQKGNFIVLDIKANGFLHHMVRNIVGVLISIGNKQRAPLWAKEVLDSKDRRCGGITAPPYGLYFSDVNYPQEFNLPLSSLKPFFY